MKKLFILVTVLLLSHFINSQQVSNQQYREDFEFFWTTIKNNYCYWKKKQTDWAKVKVIYFPLVDTVSSRGSFIRILEKVLDELYDHHASLNTNTMESWRLVPSGADLWAEFINGKPVITEVRLLFGAHNAGLKAGMEIVKINDIPVEEAVEQLIPRSLKRDDTEAKNFVLRQLLAGTHSSERKISIKRSGESTDYFPDQPVNLLRDFRYNGSIQSKIFPGNIGYIRINNQLWNNDLIPLFDSVLNSLFHTKALVLDLRETPGGGNTTVARSIMGRLIKKEGFYQKHILTSEEAEFGIRRSWVEIVSPKVPVYSKPLVILVNHWTGSVAEGISIGFDALKRGTTIGTKMAGLNGAIYSFTMPHSGIGFSFPMEELLHINNTPREDYQPAIKVDVRKQENDQDRIVEEAIRFINTKKPTVKK